jgi:hypothetical protein
MSEEKLNDRRVNKVGRVIRLKVSDGAVIKGRIFLDPEERVIDMLNDARDFIPFEDETTAIFCVNKNHIIGIFDDLDQVTGTKVRQQPRSEPGQTPPPSRFR